MTNRPPLALGRLDNRKRWYYRGCTIIPVTTSGWFKRRLWESFVPGRTGIISRTKAGARAYIDKAKGATQ